MINLRTVDLNLLPVFEAVFEERNMTRAAGRLAMSQPAVSNAVGRLRSALRDELFVAGRRGTAVTPMAEEIYPQLKAALDTLRGSLGERRRFMPLESDRHFAIGLLYAPGVTFGQRLADWLRRSAPRLSFRLVPVDERSAGHAALRDGRVDLLLDHAAPAARDLDSAVLFDDELVVIASAAHPRLGATLSRREFLGERHVAHRSLRMPGSALHIENSLGGRHFDIAVEVREPIELPITVAGTEFIAVCNRRLAEPWMALLGLKLLPLPFRTAALQGHLVWHARRHQDAGHQWIHDGMAALAREPPVALIREGRRVR